MIVALPNSQKPRDRPAFEPDQDYSITNETVDLVRLRDLSGRSEHSDRLQYTWMAFAVVADAAKVTPRRVSEEDVSAEIDRLGLPHKTPTGARQPGQVHRGIDRNEDIDVFRDRLGR
jgi:hypothetical protein